MTTFAQWRSPANRFIQARLERKPRKFDIRVVDHFYAYCQAVSRTDRYRQTVARAQRAAKRTLWTMLIAGGFLC